MRRETAIGIVIFFLLMLVIGAVAPSVAESVLISLPSGEGLR